MRKQTSAPERGGEETVDSSFSEKSTQVVAQQGKHHKVNISKKFCAVVNILKKYTVVYKWNKFLHISARGLMHSFCSTDVC